ncbi:MAG: carboxypeptidase regulatory-like domain-containing protein [Herminiimonas sp.]|nr:carboxypeptidase regulatory-like domain-containing protein [Herminiimonas sp.]
MQAKATGSINGQVRRKDGGAPLAGATVGISHGIGPLPDIALLTNSDGWFTLDDLPVGEWGLRACGPSGEFGEAMTKVASEQVSEIVILLS